MATTGTNFVRMTAAQLVGAAVAAAGKVVGFNPSNASQVVAGGTGVALDRQTVDLAAQSFALNGAATVALSGTTAKTVDLTDLTSVTDSYAGDTTFAGFTQLTFKNLGAGSVTIAPGGSNPASIGLGGTTPTLTLAPGASHTLNYGSAVTVDSTHKTILLTPAATTVVSIAVGGQ